MPVQTPTLTRNTLKQVVVLSSDPKGTEQIEWKPAGDPSGDDIQPVSDVILGLPAFSKLLARGIIKVEEASAETQEALDRQTAAFMGRLNSQTKAEDVMDRQTNNDLLSVECIGPDDRGTGACGTPVPVNEKSKDEKPPLCNKHGHLAAQYVSHEVQEGTTISVKWSRVTVTAPERQQA